MNEDVCNQRILHLGAARHCKVRGMPLHALKHVSATVPVVVYSSVDCPVISHIMTI